MADGQIVIDVDIPIDSVQSDVETINNILKKIGNNSGKELDDNFKQATSEMKQEADDTSKDIKEKLGEKVETKIDVNNTEAKSKINQTKEDLNDIPKTKETKVTVNDTDANSKAGKIKEIFEKIPGVKNIKLAADDLGASEKVQKIKGIISAIPKSKNTTVSVEDRASANLKTITKNEDETAKHATSMKDIIKGAFIGGSASQILIGALGAVKDQFVGLISTGTQYNRLQQDMNATWTTLTGSASKGKELVKETNDLATAAQNSTEMVNDLNQKFYAVTNSASKTRELSKSVLTLQDAFGQSDEAVKNFSMQWSQMIGNGKANAQDMMSIQNVFPKFKEELLDYERQVSHNSNLTMASLNDMMSKGKISADTMNKVLISMGDKYKNATNNFSQTMDGMGRTIQARVPVLAGMIVKPFQDLKNPLLGKMSNWIASSGAEKSFENFGKSIANIMQGVMGIINNFATAFKANVGPAITNSHIGDLGKVFQEIGKALSPVLQQIGSFAGIIAGNAFSLFNTWMSNMYSNLINIDKKKSALDFSSFTNVFKNLGQAINAITPFAQGLVAVLATVVGIFSRGFMAGAIDVFNGIAKAISGVFNALKQVIPQADGVNKATGAIAKNGAAIEALGKVVGTLAGAWIAGKGAIMLYQGAVNGVKAVMVAYSTVVKTVQAVMEGFRIAWTLLDAAMDANPIGMIVLGLTVLAGVFVLAYKNIKPFRDAVNAAWQGIKDFFDWIGKNIGKFTSQIVNGFGDVVKWFKKNWGDVALLLVNPIDGGLKLLYNNNPKFKKWVNDLASGMKQGWNKMSKGVDDFFKNFGPNMQKGWNNAIKSSHDFFTKLWGGLGDATKKMGKDWDNFAKGLSNNRYINAMKKGNLFSTLFKDGEKQLASFQKSWNKGWKSAQTSLGNAWKSMQKNTSNWGNNIQSWYKSFNKTFAKNWNKGWQTAGKTLSDGWNNMMKGSQNWGSNMQDWLGDFGDKFKDGWHSISKGVSNIFRDLWDGMKKLAKDAMNGLIDIVNGGIGGINTVIYAFGGKKTTVSPLKHLATGTGAFSGPRKAITSPTLAMVNDGFDSPETGNKEALYRPATGEFGIFQGRNTTTMLMPGDEVLNASETAMIMGAMGVDHFAGGTGFFGSLGGVFSGIGSWIGQSVDKLKAAFDMAKKIIANPGKALDGIFSFKNFNSGKGAMLDIAKGAFGKADDQVKAFGQHCGTWFQDP